jgi:hypothetical protein
MAENKSDTWWFDRDEQKTIPVDSLRFRARNGMATEARRAHCLARAIVKPPLYMGNPLPQGGDHISLGSARMMENGNREQLMACSRCLIVCAVEQDEKHRAVGVTEVPGEHPFYSYRGTINDCPLGTLKEIPVNEDVVQ